MPWSIAMISDFFLPVPGGVEIHIYSLAVALIARGHKVVIITHSREGTSGNGPNTPRIGIRYLHPALKVYYLPVLPITSDATLPQYLTNLPFLRNILVRERVQILHGHASLSSMALEGLMQCAYFKARPWIKGKDGKSDKDEEKTVRTVFTDHSLFPFGDAVGVLTNKLLAGAMRNIDAVICVSHAGRENTTMRAQLDPRVVSVLPSAIDSETFTPRPDLIVPQFITIVAMTRLVYRKGIDLLVSAAPKICALYPQVRFIIGGEGPKMVELEQMREQHLLQDRVVLMGSVSPSDVHSVLNRGQVYLSTSLTEAFGISIIEAASAGMFIVSTKVGGVPEVLPNDMIEFAATNTQDVVRALSIAVETIMSGVHDPYLAHERVKGMYTWANVAERTERVYEKAMSRPERDLFERMSRYLDLGPVFGPILCVIMAVQGIYLAIFDWLQPREQIDLVPLTPEVS